MNLDGPCLQVQKLVDEWIEDQVLQIEENKCALIFILTCKFLPCNHFCSTLVCCSLQCAPLLLFFKHHSLQGTAERSADWFWSMSLYDNYGKRDEGLQCLPFASNAF